MGDSPATFLQTSDDNPSSDQDVVTLARGGGILFAGRLFEYASRFVFGIILARALGADGYGLYTLGLAAIVVLGGVAVLGLDAAMEHFLPDAIHKRDEDRIWGMLQIGLALPAVFGIVIVVIVFAMAGFLADNLYDQPEAASILRWVSLVVPLRAVGHVLLGATRAFKRMEFQVYADSILLNVSRIGLSVLLLGMGFGVPGVLAAYALGWILTDGLLLFFLHRRLFPLGRPLHASQRPVRQMLSFSGPVCLGSVVETLGGSAEILLLGMLSTLAAVGIYSAAERIQMVGFMFLGAASLAAKPIISDLYHRGETAQLARFYQTLSRWSLSFVLPYFLTAVLFAGPILAIFGEEFEAGSMVLILISTATLVHAGTGLSHPMIVMTGHSKLSFLNTIVIVLLSMILSLVLIPAWGLIGAAVATLLSSVIINVARLFQVYWLQKTWPYNMDYVKPILASAAALGVGLVMRYLAPAGQSLAYLLLDVVLLWSAYIGTTLLLGLSPDDRIVLTRTKRRFKTLLSWR